MSNVHGITFGRFSLVSFCTVLPFANPGSCHVIECMMYYECMYVLYTAVVQLNRSGVFKYVVFTKKIKIKKN
jgi:hypothetical protein